MLDNEVDMLSKLPDDVLLNIVERLDITEVARTAILSTRWKQIPAMLSKIILTVCSFVPKDGRRKLTSDDIARANTTMLKATKSILESRSGSLYTMDQISMRFYLGDDSMFFAQTVANTLATQKVASVEFTIFTELGKHCTSDDALTYGKKFMSLFDSCPNAFGGLTHLHLQNLRLGESYFPKFFGTCKQLEFLHLWRCDTGHLSLLEVQHPQIRELVISSSSLQRVDLKWVPKLTVVKFQGFQSPDDPFILGYVPLLQTVSIINTGLSWHKMLKLSELLRKTAIRNLDLNFRSEKIWVKPEGRKQLLPVFHKLSLVNLFNISEECDLSWTMFILQGAPILKKLCIMVRDHLCEMIKGKRRYMYAYSEEKDKGLEWEPSAPDFKHHNLAELRIYGFQAEEKFVRYARNVMEAAVNLEAVYLHENPGCEKCKPCLPNEWTLMETLLIRDKINKGICSNVGIHFPSRGRKY
ncbi:putative F-box/LRR-repeat protein At3g58880 [Lolium rigidum]|uniref:putative F-box/LRR-repeat protein At3g58880 n=1 Tax=Lolium rigidum TaxID=89674 RepID=UPI001F5C4206|nr:putative F-box/LRR-repeat protein At3g58880 [Lolium rigidum]